MLYKQFLCIVCKYNSNNISALEHIILEPYSRTTNRTMYTYYKIIATNLFSISKRRREPNGRLYQRYQVSLALKALFAGGGWIRKRWHGTHRRFSHWTLLATWTVVDLILVIRKQVNKTHIFLVLSVALFQYFWNFPYTCAGLSAYNQTFIYYWWMDFKGFIAAKIMLWWQVWHRVVRWKHSNNTLKCIWNWTAWSGSLPMNAIDIVLEFRYLYLDASNTDVKSKRRPIVSVPIRMIERNAVFIMCIHYFVHHYWWVRLYDAISNVIWSHQQSFCNLQLTTAQTCTVIHKRHYFFFYLIN